jgi:hypothetical protein
MNVKKIRRLFASAIVMMATAVFASLVIAAPANAYFWNASGASGSARPLLQVYCEGAGKLDYNAPPNFGYYAELKTPLLAVTPSPSYSLPQTVVEATRLDYSTDDGLTWREWKWISQSMQLTSRSEAALQPQSVYLPQGFSYRIVQVLQFKVGTSIVGLFGIGFNRRDDYSFAYASGVFQPSSLSITPTTNSIGCTVR